MQTQTTVDPIALKKTFAELSTASMQQHVGNEQLLTALQKSTGSAQAPTPDEVLTYGKIVSVIAKNTTDDEWRTFLETGKRPDVLPLTPSQLEASRGGGWVLEALGVVAVSVGLATVGPAIVLGACVTGIAIGAGIALR